MRPGDREAVGEGAAILLALFALSDRQRYVVIQRTMRDRKLQDIADEMGLSKQGVSIAEQTALARLRISLAGLAEAA